MSHVQSGTAHSGTGFVTLGTAESAGGAVLQQLTVPSGATRLTYWLSITATDTSRLPHDFLYVEVLNTSGRLLGTLATYSNLDETSASSYVLQAPSISAYAGQTIRLAFRVATDALQPTTFLLDDVAMELAPRDLPGRGLSSSPEVDRRNLSGP